MPTPITPTDVSLGTTGAWTDIDVSAHVAAGATGVMIHVVSTSTGAAVGLRKNGSTDNRTQDALTTGHFMGFAGLDANGVFEGYIGSTNIDFWLVGYFTADEAVFFDNAIDISTTGIGFEDVDISSHTGSDTALAALVEVTAGLSTSAWMLRQKGSTDTRIQVNFGGLHQWGITGVDGSQVFERDAEVPNDLAFFLVGYITDSIVWNTNRNDRQTATSGSFVDVTALPAGAVMGIYNVIKANAGNAAYAVRKNGSAENIYRDVSSAAQAYAIVECDVDGVVEQKIEGPNVDLYELGYFEASPSGGGGETVAVTGHEIPVVIGTPTSDTTVTVGVTGLGVAIAIGDPTTDATVTVPVDGYAVPVAFGTPAVVQDNVPQTVAVDGLAVPVQFGDVTVINDQLVAVIGLDVRVEFGTVTVEGGGTVIVTPEAPGGIGKGGKAKRRQIIRKDGTVVTPRTQREFDREIARMLSDEVPEAVERVERPVQTKKRKAATIGATETVLTVDPRVLAALQGQVDMLTHEIIMATARAAMLGQMASNDEEEALIAILSLAA